VPIDTRVTESFLKAERVIKGVRRIKPGEGDLESMRERYPSRRPILRDKQKARVWHSPGPNLSGGRKVPRNLPSEPI